MYIDETDSDRKNESADYGNAVVLTTTLQCGPKKLRMSLILENDEDDDDEWENWVSEDLRRKAGVYYRAFWVHGLYTDRDSRGEFARICVPLREHPDKFFKYFRMSPSTYDYILESIEERITKHSNRQPIAPSVRLAVTLRYLATGTSFQALSESFLMAPYTISKIVPDVCDAIYEALVEKHMPVPSPADFKRIAAEYKMQWDFPSVIGAMDGKHIRIKCPPNSGSMYFNYKKFFSIVLQAVADSNLKFIFVDVGGYGKQGDAGTFASSTLNAFLKNPKNFPDDRVIAGIKYPVPYLFVADDAYPLRQNLLKPHSKTPVTPEQQIFNRRLSRARRCVECAFGVLANKWRLLLREIETSDAVACSIVKSLTVLHNIVIERDGMDRVLLQKVMEKIDANNKERMRFGRKYNRCTCEASKLRDALTDYFVSEEGSVPWQLRYLK